MVYYSHRVACSTFFYQEVAVLSDYPVSEWERNQTLKDGHLEGSIALEDKIWDNGKKELRVLLIFLPDSDLF